MRFPVPDSRRNGKSHIPGSAVFTRTATPNVSHREYFLTVQFITMFSRCQAGATPGGGLQLRSACCGSAGSGHKINHTFSTRLFLSARSRFLRRVLLGLQRQNYRTAAGGPINGLRVVLPELQIVVPPGEPYYPAKRPTESPGGDMDYGFFYLDYGFLRTVCGKVPESVYFCRKR